MTMSNADDITVAAARAATPPKSQLDMLAMRVTELEKRTQVASEQQGKILQLIEHLHKMQVATIEEVHKRMTEFVAALQQRQQSQHEPLSPPT